MEKELKILDCFKFFNHILVLHIFNNTRPQIPGIKPMGKTRVFEEGKSLTTLTKNAAFLRDFQVLTGFTT